MVVSCVLVATIGTSRVGGLGRIFEVAAEGERLEMFNLDTSPFKLATFWTIVVGVTMSWTSGSAISPSVVQRFVSLSTVKKAQWSVLWFHIGCFIFFSLSCFMGLVIYAHYHSCDPRATGGAFVGGLSGLVVLRCVITGSRAAFAAGDLVYPGKPISVQGCLFNLTDIHSVVPPGKTSENVFGLYELSVFLYVTLGTVIVGLISSYLTAANKVESVDRSLLTPVIHRFLPEYRPVSAKEVELKEMPHIIKDGR